MKEAKNGIAVTFEGEGLPATPKERTFDRVLDFDRPAAELRRARARSDAA